MLFLGKPYDTLDEVIGIRENASSLKAFNVKYKEIALKNIDKLEEIIKEIRKVDKDVIIFVDNCYSEFVERKTPITVGADIIVRFAHKKFRWRNCTKPELMLQARKNMLNLFQKD